MQNVIFLGGIQASAAFIRQRDLDMGKRVWESTAHIVRGSPLATAVAWRHRRQAFPWVWEFPEGESNRPKVKQTNQCIDLLGLVVVA